MTIGDIAVGKVCRSDQGLIGDGDPVVGFVLIADALEDLDRVSNGWLFDLHRLEATLKRSIFFEVLAILVGGGCANGLQLATSQHWLED